MFSRVFLSREFLFAYELFITIHPHMKRICRVKFSPPSFSGLIAKMNSRLRLNAQAGRWHQWKNMTAEQKRMKGSVHCVCVLPCIICTSTHERHESTLIFPLTFFYSSFMKMPNRKKSDTELCGGKPLFRTLGKKELPAIFARANSGPHESGSAPAKDDRHIRRSCYLSIVIRAIYLPGWNSWLVSCPQLALSILVECAAVTWVL